MECQSLCHPRTASQELCTTTSPPGPFCTMDSSNEPNINGKSCVSMETLEETLSNKGGTDGVTQDKLEPVLLSLFPVAPDLQPWRILEESCIIVTPSENTIAGQSSTQTAGNSPLSLENQSGQHGPPVRNIGVDRSRVIPRRQRNGRCWIGPAHSGSRANEPRHRRFGRHN